MRMLSRILRIDFDDDLEVPLTEVYRTAERAEQTLWTMFTFCMAAGLYFISQNLFIGQNFGYAVLYSVIAVFIFLFNIVAMPKARKRIRRKYKEHKRKETSEIRSTNEIRTALDTAKGLHLLNPKFTDDELEPSVLTTQTRAYQDAKTGYAVWAALVGILVIVAGWVITGGYTPGILSLLTIMGCFFFCIVMLTYGLQCVSDRIGEVHQTKKRERVISGAGNP